MKTITRQQARIERAYQRAMDIRDSLPGFAGAIEDVYAKAYRRAFRKSDAFGFAKETRWYLKQIRKAASDGI